MTTITFGPTDSLLLIKQSADGTGIEKWEYSLDSGSSYTLINNYPVYIERNITNSLPLLVEFENNLNIYTLDHGIVINIADNLTIDGKNNRIITNNLITIVKPFFRSSIILSNLIIKNIKYVGTKITDYNDAFMFSQDFGSTGENITIDNIENYKSITGTATNNLSGIFSINCFRYSRNILIQNCKNFGTINRPYSSGIFGRYSFENATNVTILNCFNSGNITVSALNSGGIFAPECFTDYRSKGYLNINNKFHTVYKCHNKGNIVGENSGGIFGSYCFSNIREADSIDLPTDGLVISDCYNTGYIQGAYCGGIFAREAFNSTDNAALNIAQNIEINFCYNTGNITGNISGGLFGYSFFSMSPNFYTININNCYNTGTLSSSLQGGIMAYHQYYSTQANTYNINNTYSVVPSMYNSNAIYPPEDTEYDPDLRIINLNNTNSDNTWNQSNAFLYLGGTSGANVNNISNNYNNFSFVGEYTDISVVDSSGAISTYQPYKLTSFNEKSNGVTFTNITPGSNITFENTPVGTYSIVSSNILNKSNLYLYSAFGTLNNATITTDQDLLTQINKYFIIYQDSGIYDYRLSTAVSDTYNILIFSISIMNTSTPVICMGENTLITTLENNIEVDKPIKHVQIGELIKTNADKFIPVKYIYKSYCYNTANNPKERKKDKLYLLTKDNFPELKDDLYLTGGHPLVVDHLSETEYKRQQRLNLNKNDTFIENKKILLVFASDKVLDFTETGIFPIYNLVLENVDGKDRHLIKINGLLTSSMSVDKYEKYIKIID